MNNNDERDYAEEAYNRATMNEEEDRSVTVRVLVSDDRTPGLRTASQYSTFQFEDGALAYDVVRAAVKAGVIVCLSTVVGPGADAYNARGAEVFAGLRSADMAR